jgi:hypothetical protein
LIGKKIRVSDIDVIQVAAIRYDWDSMKKLACSASNLLNMVNCDLIRFKQYLMDSIDGD